MPRFMLTLKADENAPFGEPPPELFEGIGKLAEHWGGEGVLVDTAGMAPTAMSARVRLAGGSITSSGGPFTDEKEVATAYAIVSVDSQDDAVKRATEFLELHRQHWPVWEGTSEVRQLFGPAE